MNLPESVEVLTGDKLFTVDDVGCSGSEVRIYDDMVLKIESPGTVVDTQVKILRWLEGKLSVPKVLCHEIMDGKSYLLMSRIAGKMSCDQYYKEHPDEVLALTADGFKQLWSVDISDCPVDRSLDVELAEIEARFENGDFPAPDTFQVDGFDSPFQLLEWLKANKPSYDPVFSHGDFCMPNIFFEGGRVNGFIDLGDAGVADRWRDIAVCRGSLKRNFNGSYGGKVYPDFDPDRLFEYLGIELDQEKLRYYTLLNELY